MKLALELIILGLVIPLCVGLQRFQLKRRFDKSPTLHDHLYQLKTKYNAKNANTPTPSSFSTTANPNTDPVNHIKMGNYMSVQYYGPISLGTGKGAKCFEAVFDTASADIWIPGPTCNDSACDNHLKFDCGMSPTCQETQNKYTMQYGNGLMQVTGDGMLDRFCFGCAPSDASCIDNQHFLSVSSETAQNQFVRQGRADGLVGLAYDNLAQTGVTPFTNYISTGDCPQEVFAFWLNQNRDQANGGEMTLCGIDPDHYVGDLMYTPVIEQRYWKFHASSLKVGNDAIMNNFKAIADTATPFIGGPSLDITNIYYELGVKFNQSYGAGFTDCANRYNMPNVTLTIEGAEFLLTPFSYAVPLEKSTCVVLFTPVDLIDESWVLGDAFLGAYYTVFDRLNNRIGFAPATPPVQASAKLQAGFIFTVLMAVIMRIF